MTTYVWRSVARNTSTVLWLTGVVKQKFQANCAPLHRINDWLYRCHKQSKGQTLTFDGYLLRNLTHHDAHHTSLLNGL